MNDFEQADRRPPVVTSCQSIAAAIDEVGPDKAPILLAKLALILSHEIGDAERISSCVERAKADL